MEEALGPQYPPGSVLVHSTPPPPAMPPALLWTNRLADSPSADDDQMIISKWRRATYQAVDPHHSSRGYQITGDTVESIAEVLWQWFMHIVYNPSGFFDVTPYPLIH